MVPSGCTKQQSLPVVQACPRGSHSVSPTPVEPSWTSDGCPASPSTEESVIESVRAVEPSSSRAPASVPVPERPPHANGKAAVASSHAVRCGALHMRASSHARPRAARERERYFGRVGKPSTRTRCRHARQLGADDDDAEVRLHAGRTLLNSQGNEGAGARDGAILRVFRSLRPARGRGGRAIGSSEGARATFGVPNVPVWTPNVTVGASHLPPGRPDVRFAVPTAPDRVDPERSSATRDPAGRVRERTEASGSGNGSLPGARPVRLEGRRAAPARRSSAPARRRAAPEGERARPERRTTRAIGRARRAAPPDDPAGALAWRAGGPAEPDRRPSAARRSPGEADRHDDSPAPSGRTASLDVRRGAPGGWRALEEQFFARGGHFW
jgi:hypothetical protein